MRRRFPFAIAIAPVLVALLSATGPFDGCGGARPEPRPLPDDPEDTCFTDDDCYPEDGPLECRDLQCIAGACTEVAPFRDPDRDGFAAAPCGEDCNDDDRSIHPGANEACDLVDQDCDGTIDEMAPERAIRFEAPTIDPHMVALPWGDDVLVSDTAINPGMVRARPVAIAEQSLGPSIPVADLGDGRVVLGASARATDAGGVIALATRDESGADPELVILTIERASGGAADLVGAPIVHPTRTAGPIALALLGGVPYVAWDEGTSRRLWSPGWADDVEIAEGLVEGVGPLDLASDGSHVVASIDPRTLGLFDPDGTSAGTQELAGELAPGRPLADDAGGVWAIFRDAFDYSVQRASLGGVSAPATVPHNDSAGLVTLLFGADLLGSRLYYARARSAGATVAWAEVDDLDNPSDHLTMEQITGTPRGPIRSIEVIEVPAGPVVVTSYGDAGSAFTLLACRAGGT